MKQQIEAVMSREMDRLMFLKLVGAGLVAFTGIGAAFKALEGVANEPAHHTTGYGSSPYGGGPRHEARSN